MLKSIKSIKLIGYSLCLLYLTAFLMYFILIPFPGFGLHAAVFFCLNLSLFIASLAMIRLKEWGRKILVFGNILTALYAIALWRNYPDFMQASYLFMNIVVALFFSQGKVKVCFQPNWKLFRKSVLIVDDDEGTIKTVKRILLPNGYSVLGALTGERGLQISKLQKPDLIILDVILPGIKGREVCLKLKSEPETENIPVLFLTAKDSPDDVAAEMAVGGHAHLTKPVDAKVLLAEVKRLLGDT